MSVTPIIPDSAPFTAEQRAWLNGFLAGVLGASAPAGSTAPAMVAARRSLLILFGSQSGNAESLAKALSRDAAGRGFDARAVSMDSMPAAELAKHPRVLIVTSTWGDGDMPDNAAALWQALNQNGATPSLDGVSYSVLALGDRNYGETFCMAGRRMDERFAELGARRVFARTDCDVEYDEPARLWSEGVLAALLDDPAPAESLSQPAGEPAASIAETGYSKKNPFPAVLIANRKLNAAASVKDTRHVAFSLGGSGLSYEPGDALGIVPQNCPGMVDAVIRTHRLSPEAEVSLPNGDHGPLREALLNHYEVRAKLGIEPPQPVAAAEWVGGLRKLQPRLYSIASSLNAHPGEVHLCVAAVRYESAGLKHKGVASTFLADRLAIGDTAGVLVHKAAHFRLPVDPGCPVIMVGPGTGIAPFRAFLQERRAAGAHGRNWLFFGDQKAASDYLYQDEIEQFRRDGILTKLELAFSRDQPEKIYVQHRMLEQAGELWAWLDAGAHFYVCGDATRMAKDVDAALHGIIQNAGGLTAEQAAAYVAEMKRTKRYARDVY